MALKAALGAVVALVVSGGMWAFALVAQSLDTDTVTDTVLPSTALVITAGALWRLVQFMASGKLVHHNTADTMRKLTEALERSNRVAEKGHEREDVLIEVLTEHRRKR